eukprot:SAG25_NODE_479_length_7519_cov_4.794340_5_plen_128_part_00
MVPCVLVPAVCQTIGGGSEGKEVCSHGCEKNSGHEMRWSGWWVSNLRARSLHDSDTPSLRSYLQPAAPHRASHRDQSRSRWFSGAPTPISRAPRKGERNGATAHLMTTLPLGVRDMSRPSAAPIRVM